MNKQQQEYLAAYRKRNDLTLSDIAFLLQIDVASISRMESGKRPLTPEALLGYHLLFDLPMDKVAGDAAYNDLREKVKDRCFLLVEKIQEEKASLKGNLRLKTLDTLIRRLSPDLSNVLGD